MHVNNEVGAVLDIDLVARICQQNNALFHSDTVQSVAKTELDLQNTPVDFIVAAAHKFHGPKGIGFAFIRKNSGLQPLIYGGEQEKGLRPGTEAVHQIAGMAKAIELALFHLNEERKEILALKNYLIERLEKEFPDFKINGSRDGFYNVLNRLSGGRSFLLGFQMLTFPQTAAIMAFQLQTATGKLKAEIMPTAPIGCHCSYMRWLGRSLCMVKPYNWRLKPTAKSQISIISCTSPNPSRRLFPISQETNRPKGSLYLRSSSPN
jgi:hypothetical protein